MSISHLSLAGRASSAVAALLALACTDVGLRGLKGSQNDRVALRGDFCTGAPAKAQTPIRILFAVDSSDSMLFNDPANLHVDAIESVVRRFREDTNVSFGILRWGESIVRELVDYAGDTPALFSNDAAVLDAAFARMRQPAAVNRDKYLGGTNYVQALDAVRDYITQDQALNPGFTGVAQYYVELMTDGMPQADNNNPALTRDTILARVEALATSFVSLRVDVLSIVELATVPPEFFNLLPQMAERGKGSYVQVSGADAFDAELAKILTQEITLVEYDLARFNLASDFRSILVTNTNVRIAQHDGRLDVHLDSDGDGLIDLEERAKGYNPAAADSDGDGLDDFFEDRHLGEFDPRARQSPALTEEQRSDADRDGLILFAEHRLGLDATVPDSDGDGIVDGFEYRAGTDPLVKDLESDYDRDRVSNAFELVQHTNPYAAEEAPLLDSRAYRMETVGDPYQIFNGRRCYRFFVDNITLGNTLAHTDLGGVKRPAGYNKIDIWWLEHPAGPDSDKLRRVGLQPRTILGSTWVIFRPDVPLRDPPAMELDVRSVNFTP